jgi:hypothetical protein
MVGRPSITAEPPLPVLLERTDEERLRCYRDNLAFYNGSQWPGRARRGERRLTFNYAKALVDKVTSYLLNGQTVQLEAPDGDSEAGRVRVRTAEQALRAVESANALAQLDFETELDCAVLGDAAYKVTWDAEAGEVRVSAPDVQGIFAWRQADDPSRITAVASQYRASEELTTEYWTPQTFELWHGSELVERQPNPFGFIPFVIFPNLRQPKQTWGSSDIPALVESNRELNRAYSQLSLILELSGNPVAVLEGISQANDIVIEPGAVWELPEKARAYVLDMLNGGGVALHKDYIDLIYQTLHDLGESPRTAFGHNPQGLSGVALNTELDPIAKKVARKQLIRGAVYERRAALILRLLQQYTGLDSHGLRPVMHWGPILPIDRSREVADEVSLVSAGIESHRTAAAHLGAADPDAEFARVQAERA